MAKSIEMKDKILENAVKITREEITDLFPKDCVKEHVFNAGSPNSTVEIEVTKPGCMSFYISVGTPEVAEVVFYAESDSNLGRDWLPRYDGSLSTFQDELHWLLKMISSGKLGVEIVKLGNHKISSRFILTDGSAPPSWLHPHKFRLAWLGKREVKTFAAYR